MIKNKDLKKLIDISDINTYPQPLLKLLKNHENLLITYCDATDYFAELRNEDSWFRWRSYNNRFADACINCFKDFNKILCNKTFMYVHYTRLLEREIQNIKAEGLKILSPQLMEEKLKHLEGILDSNTIINLKNEANKSFGSHAWMYTGERQNMVWVTTLKDSCCDYSGIIHLLNNWGGENIFKWERETNLLKNIGYPAFIIVKFSFEELSNLLPGSYDIACGIIKCYMIGKHNKCFEWSLCNWNNQEICVNNSNEIHIHTNIDVKNIVDLYKWGDKFFNNTIHLDIMKNLCISNIINYK
ncbi:MAG: hypothetical protein QG673_1608 [Pseudomonadota bacterium]|nr:hypothetical protein [Pseudomonadota bacterium]